MTSSRSVLLVATVATALATALALATVCGARPAAAHATVVAVEPANGETVPSAPARVTVRFDEPIALAGDDSVVLDDVGAPVSLAVEAIDREVRYELPDDLDDGTYVVVWGVISIDSHRVGGSSTFHVGASSASTVEVPTNLPAAAGIGALRLAATATLLGAALVAVGAAWFARRWAPLGEGTLDRLVTWCCIGGLVVLALLMPVRSVELAGRWDALGRVDPLRDAVVGPIGLGAALAGAGLLAILGSVRFGQQRLGVWGAGAALVVAGLAAEGHTRSATPRWLVIGSDMVHVVAAAFWFGGVVALVVARRSVGDDAARRRAALDVSTHAIGAVAAVTIAGVAMAWTISPDLDAFVSTRWGISVLAKIGIVGVLVAIGWVNRSRLLPRLAPHDGAEDHGTEDHGTEDHGTEDHGAEENEMVEAKLRTTLRVELVLFAAVVVVTGIVIASSPETADAIDNSPAEPGVAEVHETLELSSGAASVSIDLVPGRLGYNDLYLVVTDAKGAPTVPEFEPTVELSAPEHGIDTIELFVHDLGGGTYHVPVDIPIAGGWEVTIKVRTSTFETGNAQFDVDIG